MHAAAPVHGRIVPGSYLAAPHASSDIEQDAGRHRNRPGNPADLHGPGPQALTISQAPGRSDGLLTFRAAASSDCMRTPSSTAHPDLRGQAHERV